MLVMRAIFGRGNDSQPGLQPFKNNRSGYASVYAHVFDDIHLNIEYTIQICPLCSVISRRTEILTGPSKHIFLW